MKPWKIVVIVITALWVEAVAILQGSRIRQLEREKDELQMRLNTARQNVSAWGLAYTNLETASTKMFNEAQYAQGLCQKAIDEANQWKQEAKWAEGALMDYAQSHKSVTITNEFKKLYLQRSREHHDLIHRNLPRRVRCERDLQAVRERCAGCSVLSRGH